MGLLIKYFALEIWLLLGRFPPRRVGYRQCR